MSKNQKGQPKKSSGPLPEWSHVIIPKPAKNIFINGPIIGKGADKITDDAYRRIKFSDLI